MPEKIWDIAMLFSASAWVDQEESGLRAGWARRRAKGRIRCVVSF